VPKLSNTHLAGHRIAAVADFAAGPRKVNPGVTLRDDEAVKSKWDRSCGGGPSLVWSGCPPLAAWGFYV